MEQHVVNNFFEFGSLGAYKLSLNKLHQH